MGWLRDTLGAYEWWYFDALSDDGEWALACVWFLGNPFSPYYRLAALGEQADPADHNALFFALYRHGRLHAYHFTRFPINEVDTADRLPGVLRLGPNRLGWLPGGGGWLAVTDENANRRRLDAELRFDFPPLVASPGAGGDAGETHFWLPAAPACRVSGEIRLREAQNAGAEVIRFSGQGYHDHNWGRLPFDADIRDWYWARAALGEGRAVVLYHVRYHRPRAPVSHLLFFEGGCLMRYAPKAKVRLSRRCVNGFGTAYATRLTADDGDTRVVFRLGDRLDSAPFYVRALCDSEVQEGTSSEAGRGMGEYLRPGVMSRPLVASAMKARIVEG